MRDKDKAHFALIFLKLFEKGGGEDMLASVAMRKEQAQNTVPCHLKLVKANPMPEATYVAKLYQKAPEEGLSPHPQDDGVAEVYKVEGLNAGNGFYAVPIKSGYENNVRKFFLSEAKEVTGHLPDRPYLGMDEVALRPLEQGKRHWLVPEAELYETLREGIQGRHVGRSLDFK